LAERREWQQFGKAEGSGQQDNSHLEMAVVAITLSQVWRGEARRSEA
jgi:hypothetical protein